MYLKHFGLRAWPFNNDIAVEETYASAASAEAQTRLTHLVVDLRGIGLITGEPGSGKTTACRTLCGSLHSGLYKVVYVPLSTGNPMDVYKTIAWEFGLPTERSRAALYRAIRLEVTRLCGEARVRPVLVVDEAHHLRSDVLEELRLLTNYAMDSENRLCMILCGQTELRRRISMAVHEALNQRVVVRYHLPGLTRDETGTYLAHLLRRAGTELPLFEPAAVESIFQVGKGLVRKINGIAHHSLIAAALSKSRTVNADHVTAALPEVS
jgi:type II secretory pathway predicted ATPase ExeA